MMARNSALTALLCLTVCLTTHADDRGIELDSDLDYQGTKSEAVSYEFDYRVVVTPPYHTKRLRVWVPIPPTDSVQQFELLEESTFPLSVKPETHTETRFGNRFAYYEFDHPTGAQIIRRRFRVTTHEVRWKIDPNRVAKVDDWPQSFDYYLQSDASIAVTDQLRSELHKFLPQPQQAYSDLTSVIDWVESNLTYSHSNASLQGSSEHALNTRMGHCSDYHGLCSAFGRALGYPTRVTYGLAGFEKHSPSHCKLEAFVPGYGWVSYDVSETQKLIKKIRDDSALNDLEKTQLIAAARVRLQRGFRDNTWIQQTVGTDYELAPKASRPVKVVRTIYAEADGVPLPEPDPADIEKHEFSWMTAHRIIPSRDVSYPFKDIERLRTELASGDKSRQ